MQIQPSCSQHSQKHYESTLIFTFHQDGKKCTTGVLPAQTSQKCGQNDYGYGTKYKLDECSKVDFDFDNVWGLVSYDHHASVKDDWTPEWFNLNLGEAPYPRLSINGAVIKCLLDEKTNGSGIYTDKFMSFHCTPEGKRFFPRFLDKHVSIYFLKWFPHLNFSFLEYIPFLFSKQ